MFGFVTPLTFEARTFELGVSGAPPAAASDSGTPARPRLGGAMLRVTKRAGSIEQCAGRNTRVTHNVIGLITA